MKKISKKQKKDGFVTALVYFVYLLVAWGLYRMNFKFSDTLEELFIKPVIWLLPFLYIIPKDKIKASDLGIGLKNLFPSLYLSLALGVGFAFLGLIANMAKYSGISFGANLGTSFFGLSLLVSFATSITEELVFRGYLLGVLLKRFMTPFIPILGSTILWTMVHIPISYYIWGMGPLQTGIFLFLTFIYGLGASILYFKTKNIASSIFLHFLWEWPIILFR